MIILSILLNLEINIFELDGGNERLRNSHIAGRSGVIGLPIFEIINIPLNLIDILFIVISFYFLVFKRKEIWHKIITLLNNKYKSRILFLSIILFIYLGLTILLNINRVSDKQLVIQSLHLIKLFQVFIFFTIFKFLLDRIDYLLFLKFLIFSSIAFSLIGFFSHFSYFNMTHVIDNRMTFYGIILLNISILPNLFYSRSIEISNFRFWHFFLLLSLTISIISCIICGKRAIILTTILISFLSIILIYKFNETKYKKHLILCFSFPFILISFVNYTEVHKNFGEKFNTNLINKTFKLTGKEEKIFILNDKAIQNNFFELDKKIYNADQIDVYLNDIKKKPGIDFLLDDSKLTIKFALQKTDELKIIALKFPKIENDSFPTKGMVELSPFDTILTIELCDNVQNNFSDISRLIKTTFSYKEYIKIPNNKTLYNSKEYKKYNQKENYKVQKTCFLFNFDHSTTIRLMKYVKAIILTFESPFIGSGFWSSQYIFNFIPDSILQIPLEIGFLGLLIISLILYAIYRYLIEFNFFLNKYNSICLILSLVSLSSLSLFANMIYEWRYLFMFMIYMGLIMMKRSIISK